LPHGVYVGAAFTHHDGHTEKVLLVVCLRGLRPATSGSFPDAIFHRRRLTYSEDPVVYLDANAINRRKAAQANIACCGNSALKESCDCHVNTSLLGAWRV
jgi:hypothetical protein